MSRSQLKAYGPQARRDFIDMVTREAAVYGLTKSKIDPVEVTGDTAVIKGTAYPKRVARQRRQLDELVQRQGYEQTMESMAYTWFNRFMAIRYMELHGYLDHGYRVLSHPSGDATPEILQHAERVDLPGLNKQTTIDLKLDGTKDTELYRKLIVTQCNALHGAMPFLFERIDDATELLLPADLLHSESVTRKMVDSIDEEDWREVEIVGWLYQFYISEKKDQVIGKVVKSEDIPAATQLFTPNWIVKYMLHNSLGAKWLATYPDSPLKAQMDYYIEPAEQDEDVQRQLRAITPESLNPEEITLLDPACGSGHILVEAYELFKAIYQERGYRAKDIPRLVLEKNLYGLEIDERAAQLSSFALLMKAREDDRGLFSKPVALNVCCIQESNGLDIDDPGLKALFHNAKTYGSLIRGEEDLSVIINNSEQQEVTQGNSDDLLMVGGVHAQAILQWQAQILARKYDVVVANPPYMGTKYMCPELRSFLKRNYAETRKDLYACFIRRLSSFSVSSYSFVSMKGWMYQSSYRQLRKWLVNSQTCKSLIDVGTGAFPFISGEVVDVAAATFIPNSLDYMTVFFDAKDGASNQESWQFFRRNWKSFSSLPDELIAYYVDSNVFSAFSDYPSLGQIANPRRGLQTGDAPTFIRYWHEVNMLDIYREASHLVSFSIKWGFLNNGGPAIRWFSPILNIVFWADNGTAIKAHSSSIVASESLYMQEAAAWTKMSSGLPAFRHHPEGTIPGDLSPCIYSEQCLELLAYLNSKQALYLLNVINPAPTKATGDVSKVPVPLACLDSKLREYAQDAVMEANSIYLNVETTPDFPGFRMRRCSLLSESITLQTNEMRHSSSRISEIENALNTLVSSYLGEIGEAQPDQFADIVASFSPSAAILSYAIGCMMGRYSLDEPGLIYAHSANQGFDASRYTTFPADEDGILPITDIDWFEDDIANRAMEFIATAWEKEHLEENLNFLADSLDRKSSESSRECIRRYLSRDFYKDHLQTYKRRPIYWLFSSGKQRAFQCLVYLHRYNEGTLARMRTEYVIPLQSKMTARLEHLKDDIANATSTAQAKKLEKEQDLIRKQQAELLTFDEKLRHCADQRITLDLDDGVKVNYGKFGDLLAEVKAVTGGKAE